MTVEAQHPDRKQGPVPPRSTRGVRWLASRKLWIGALVLALLAIGITVFLPARRRMQALRHLATKEVWLEWSPDDEWLTERFGPRAQCLRDVVKIVASDADAEVVYQLSEFTELRELHCTQEWPNADLEDESVSALRSLTRLESLSLNGTGMSDAALADLFSYKPPMTRLLLSNTGASRQTLQAISRCDSIIELHFVGNIPHDSDFEGLAPPPNLQDLQLAGVNLGDAAVRWASQADDLKSLSLGCAQVTDDGLASLAELRNLQSLQIYQCRKLSDAGLACLESLPALESVQLPGKLFTPASLQTLQRLPNLQSVTAVGDIEDREVQLEVEYGWSDP